MQSPEQFQRENALRRSRRQLTLARQFFYVYAHNGGAFYAGRGGRLRAQGRVALGDGVQGAAFFSLVLNDTGRALAAERLEVGGGFFAVDGHIGNEGKGHTRILADAVQLVSLKGAVDIEGLALTDKVQGQHIGIFAVVHGQEQVIGGGEHFVKEGRIVTFALVSAHLGILGGEG